jgi:hypothetical protein
LGYQDYDVRNILNKYSKWGLSYFQ